MTSGRGRKPAQGKPSHGKQAQPRKNAQAKAGSGGRRQNGRTVVRFDAPAPPPELPPVFRLGVVPGATPGKWIGIWRERTPESELVLVHLTLAEQRDALLEHRVDIALVRQPIDRTDLHLIHLYDELPVVVFSVESHLAAADPTAELAVDDLAGETLFVPEDDTLDVASIADTVRPSYDAAMSTQDVIATVATGAGITVVPMSLARAHQRKDVEYRVLAGGPMSPIALAWIADLTTPAIERFVGIVRGRTVNSSRG